MRREGMAAEQSGECLAERVGALLAGKGWTLAAAESCTGGLISHLITNIPGSSAYFLGGVVAYANKTKEQVLGVRRELLIAHGAVSREVALAMAQGVRRLLGADVGLAATGIAGPSGGTPQKPVGTVFIAVSGPLGDEVRRVLATFDREGNKRFSAEAALELLAEKLKH
jgi:PncC family amidohydrolase